MVNEIGFSCSGSFCYTVWHFCHKSWCPSHKPGYHCELMGKPQCIPDMISRLFANSSGSQKLKGCEYKYPSSFQLSDRGILSHESKTISLHVFLGIYIIFTYFKRLLSSSQHQKNVNKCLQWRCTCGGWEQRFWEGWKNYLIHHFCKIKKFKTRDLCKQSIQNGFQVMEFL